MELVIKSNADFDLSGKGCIGQCEVGGDAHPNKIPFKGTLLVLDEVSTRPPNGALGHRILVTKDAAKRNLSSLIGMGLNYQTSSSTLLTSHAPSNKVGVITGARIVGNKVEVVGHIFGKDFPKAKTDLKRPGLGMSMELADVRVEDKKASIWNLTDFSFTGATVLLKNSAAYQKTDLLTAAAERALEKIGGMMATKVKKDKKHRQRPGQLESLVEVMTSSIGQSIEKSFKPFGEKLDRLVASAEENNDVISQLVASSHARSLEANASSEVDSEEEIEAAGSSDEVDDELAAAASSSSSSDSGDKGGKVKGVKAKRMKAKKQQQSSSSSSSESDYSSDSSDEIDAELTKLKKHMGNSVQAPDDTGEESEDPEPGKLNERAKGKGNKTKVSASASTGMREVIRIAQLQDKKISTMRAEASHLRKSVREERHSRKALETQVEEMQAQIETFTNTMTQRALPSQAVAILSKAGQDPNDVLSGARQPYTVAEVDEMLAIQAQAGIILKPEERMGFKNVLLERGMMEQGEMVPAYQRQRAQ